MASIPVFAPDGNVHLIPQDQYSEAINAGGVPAVKMADPSGTPRYVPRTRVAEALHSGGKLLEDPSQQATQFEKGNGQTQEQPQGAVQRFASNFDKTVAGTDNPSDVATGIYQAVRHPGTLVDSVKSMVSGAGQAQQQAIDSAYAMQHSPGVMNKIGGVARGMEASIPLVGPALMNAGDQMAAGNVAGGLGTTAGIFAPAVLAHPAAASGLSDAAANVRNAIPNPRGIMAARMAEVPPGQEFSRQQVMDSARANGVNLDLAQATDSKLAGSIKKGNQYSLTGEGAYEENTTKNVSALETWANSEAGKYSPESGGKEVVGAKLQQALKDHLESRQQLANQLFSDVEQGSGARKVDVSETVQAAAQKILDENKSYYSDNPALKPAKAWNVIQDISKQGTASITDLQRLRSDLMNETRSPDIVGSRAEGWLKQLTGAADNAMTDAGNGLQGEDLAKWRQANEVWGSIKNTYDNPQSPYYHAVRAQYPSQVPGMLSKATPELARQVRTTLGSLEGPFQRQFVENLINGKDGNLDLGRLNQRLRAIPSEHLEAMLGEDGAKQVKLLGKVSEKVLKDNNPSGTAKSVIKTTEVVNALHNPISGVAELGANYGAAKAINSPSVVDYLTKVAK